MSNKDAAREKIGGLVEKFQNDAERSSYNESMTRHLYILPLFRALGWDTESPAEFSAEEQISRGFVDFGFYLNGVPQFYLETKRVNEKLDKLDNIRQSINYSFLKGVTWAVLTDFERMMVFNAEWEEKDPRKAAFLDIQFKEYANGRFEDLWLLSKDEMAKRAIDKTAERYGRKAKKEPVTISLFNDLTDWRRRLFNEIRLQDSTLWSSDNRQVDNAVQKFFDRLIFIRTVEDRGIEASRLKSILRQKPDTVFAELRKLFLELDKVYNSNLFAPDALDMMEVHDPILLAEIINGLYKQPGNLVQYDFNAITADILGTVYEQYLGFKALDPEAKEDTSKKKKRKSQGIYYTPQYVVRYIVQQTLGRMLQEGADPHQLTVLDPACGSGSFLIEAFDVLDRWLAQTEPDVPAPERRERILKENIYGVDLDEQAIEVTRLNLMLRASFARRKLPYLTNIKHGNSLIADDSIAGKGQGFDWQARFPDVFARGGFDVVIGNPPYVRQETLGAAFKDYAKELYTTYAGTADLYVYFIEKAYHLLRENGRMGYIVPNKWLRANYGKALREFMQDKVERLLDFGDLPVFHDATTYPLILTLKQSAKTDAIDHVPTGGNVGTTSMSSAAPQNESMEMSSAKNQTAQTAPLMVANVPKLPESNQTLESILPPFYPVQRAALDKKGWSLADSKTQDLLDKLKACGVPLGEYVEGKIHIGVKTGLNEAFVIDRNTRKELIAQDPKSEELIKPYLAGRDVKRFEQPITDRYLIFTQRGVDIEAYPAIKAYFEQYKERLMPKPVDYIGKDWNGRKAGSYEWYEIQDVVAYHQEFEKPKIVFPDISATNNFTLDSSNAYCDMTNFIIASSSKYLLGILNSKVFLFMFSQISSQIRGGYLRWKNQYVSPIPIRKLDLNNPEEKAQHDKIVALVETMLKLKKELAELENSLSDRRHEVKEAIERTDKAIDALVYDLYGLSADEIAIVEGE